MAFLHANCTQLGAWTRQKGLAYELLILRVSHFFWTGCKPPGPWVPLMRRIFFALVTILVCAAATTGVRLQASTECERWIAEYRDALAHSPTVQRTNAARHRLNRYVHRKVAAVTKPKPRVLPVRYQRPKMSREEALRKMEFACGDFGRRRTGAARPGTRAGYRICRGQG